MCRVGIRGPLRSGRLGLPGTGPNGQGHPFSLLGVPLTVRNQSGVSSSSPTQHKRYLSASNMFLVQTWRLGLNSLEATRARKGVGEPPVKRQIVNVSSFTGCIVFLRARGSPRQYRSKWAGLCPSKTLFINIAQQKKQSTWETIWRLLKKLTEVPHGPAIPLLHLYPKGLNQDLKELCVLPCLLQHSSQ